MGNIRGLDCRDPSDVLGFLARDAIDTSRLSATIETVTFNEPHEVVGDQANEARDQNNQSGDTSAGKGLDKNGIQQDIGSYIDKYEG